MKSSAEAESETVPDDAAPERVLRRDAERNRRRIIDGARVVFAERGLRGSYDDVAREAEVGVGTVYRRFPDRQQLIDVLFEESIADVLEVVETALAAEDPWEGLVHFIVGLQERQCADRGLRELVFGSDQSASRLASTRAQFVPRIDRLIARAREAGVVRNDFHSTDLGIMQLAVCAIADATRDTAPDAWRRTLSVLIDGLQPTRDGVRPMGAPQLSLDQFDAALRADAASRR